MDEANQCILQIKEERKSISRFGDGELDLILGRNLKFQEVNTKLSERLEEILKETLNVIHNNRKELK